MSVSDIFNVTSIDGSATYNTQDYYGNPTDNFSGSNSGKLYGFINFYAEGNEVYDRIDIYQTNGGERFKSDNHTFSAIKQTPNNSVKTDVRRNFPPV